MWWEKPDRSWCKVKIDASSTHHHRLGGATVVVRDEDGMLISATTQPLQNKSSFYVECEACKIGLQMVFAIGVTKLQVESDCEALIKLLAGWR